MFTGLVQHRGTVMDRQPCEAGASLEIDVTDWSHRPRHGESIAVNGCCLTVASVDRDNAGRVRLRFDVIHETLGRTTLGRLQPGSAVNLEHAATPTTLLGGHIVQGHVDGVGAIASIETGDGEHRVHIAPPDALRPFIVEKGSIAVDGVSLTVAAVREGGFDVALIPTTLDLTTLGELRPGDAVNLEADYIARVIVHNMRADMRRNSGAP